MLFRKYFMLFFGPPWLPTPIMPTRTRSLGGSAAKIARWLRGERPRSAPPTTVSFRNERRDFVGAWRNVTEGISAVVLGLGSDKLVAEMKRDFCGGQRLAVECDCSSRRSIGVFCRGGGGKQQARNGDGGGDENLHLLIPF